MPPDRIIDCDIHPMLRQAADIKAYLPRQWQEHFDWFGDQSRSQFAGSYPYPRTQPYLSRRDAVPPGGGPPGSDLAFMRAQLLDPLNIEYGVLQCLEPNGPGQSNIDYGAALCRATNDWQVAEWTTPESRLKASLVVPQENPDAAIAEIRRNGRKRDFVQVSMHQRALEPLGRRRYWPIFAAAVEHDLCLGIHTGGSNGQPPVPGGGWSSFQIEANHLSATAAQGMVTSMVMEGVFEEFPTLRVVLIEGGFTWVPWLSCRLDNLWTRLRQEVPRVRRAPSEYIRKHFWFATQAMDEFEDWQDLRHSLDWMGWDRVVLSTDYPHWDYDDPRYVFKIRMSDDELRLICRDNARVAFGLP